VDRGKLLYYKIRCELVWLEGSYYTIQSGKILFGQREATILYNHV